MPLPEFCKGCFGWTAEAWFWQRAGIVCYGNGLRPKFWIIPKETYVFTFLIGAALEGRIDSQ